MMGSATFAHLFLLTFHDTAEHDQYRDQKFGLIVASISLEGCIESYCTTHAINNQRTKRGT
eukprot:5402933-Amphidinium_carterae.1